jgi:hypothetical protein
MALVLIVVQVDAVKRQCILRLPPHLIVHLKRFEFDMDTLRKKKVNDFCAIPTSLNLKTLTKEYLAAKEASEARSVRAACPASSGSQLAGERVGCGSGRGFMVGNGKKG